MEKDNRMGFIKEWWHWLSLGLVILILLGIRLFVISAQISEADKESRAARNNAKEVKNLIKEIDNKELPTAGDLEEAKKLEAQLIAERDAIEQMWEASSAGLEVKHNQTPIDYTNFLYKRCENMCWSLTRELSRLHGVPEDIIAKIPRTSTADIPKEVRDKMYSCCEPAEHHLVEYIDAGKFKTLEDTEPSWIKFLISRRIHEVVGKTSAEVNVWKVKEVKNHEPVLEQAKQIRTVERLGKIDFMDSNTNLGGRSFGRGRRSQRLVSAVTAKKLKLPGAGYYTVYPVDIDIVAHISVIQELMRNFLKSKDILFVLKNLKIIRYKDKETQAGAIAADSNRPGMTQPAMNTGNVRRPNLPGAPSFGGPGAPSFAAPMMPTGSVPTRTSSTREKKEWQKPLDLTLSTDHEPPVQAVLSYEIYRFGDFEKKKNQ